MSINAQFDELKNKNVFFNNIYKKEIVMDEKKFVKMNMREELEYFSFDENQSEVYNLM